MRRHRSGRGGGPDRPQGCGCGRETRGDLADSCSHRPRARRSPAQGRHRRARVPPPWRPAAVRPRAGAGECLRHARRSAPPARSRARPRRPVAGGRARVPRAPRPGPLAGQRRVRGTRCGVRRGRAVPGLDRADRPARRRLRNAAEEHRARVAYARGFDHRVLRAWTGNHCGTRAPSQPLPHRRASARLERRCRPVFEVACEWPVFLLVGAALFGYYVPDWRDAARTWLHRHRAGELLTVEIITLVVLVTAYLLQRLARAGFIRHRVRRQWRVAWAHVRRAPRWALGAGALLTVASIAARALILPALAWGMPGRPPFGQMFYGALALLHAPLVVPLPSGGGGLEVAFLNGFAGDFGAHQVTMLLLWRVYTALPFAGRRGFAPVRATR